MNYLDTSLYYWTVAQQRGKSLRMEDFRGGRKRDEGLVRGVEGEVMRLGMMKVVCLEGCRSPKTPFVVKFGT